jgi:hypothetical protein
LVVRDSAEFSDACARWARGLHALEGARLTPRALKRFKNRVRFYAMLRADDGPGVLPGMSDAGLVALGALEQAGLMTPGRPTREAVDLDRLMATELDDGLKHEALEALGSISAAPATTAETFDVARAAVAKA